MGLLGWALSALGAVFALGLIVFLIRRARRGDSETGEQEPTERERYFLSLGLEELDIAIALERVRDLEGFTVNIFDYDTNDFHAIPVTDELIEQARADRFRRTTGFSDIYLIPIIERMTKRQTEEKVKKEIEETLSGAEPKRVHYRECVKMHEGGRRIVSAREWAERLLASDQESLRNAWIAECVVFRANGDALIVDRDNNPILSRDVNLSKDDDLVEDDEAKIVTRLAGRASPHAGRAIRRGVLRLKNKDWVDADRIDVDVFAGSPLAEFLFRDQLDALAAHMRQREVGFYSGLSTTGLIFKAPAHSVTAVFFGDPILRFSRFDPLSLELILREHYGQIKLNNGWWYCSLVTQD